MSENIENKQSKIWLCILYLDNINHCSAIDKIKKYPKSILMHHDSTFDDKGELIGKEHYHCIVEFNNPKWLHTYIRELDLSIEEDGHLFKMLKETKSKTLKNYIIYLTHRGSDDKKEYPFTQFEGTNQFYAMDICRNLDKTNFDYYVEVKECILDIQDHIPESHIWSYGRWIRELEARGFELNLYKHWNKCKDLIKDWISYY